PLDRRPAARDDLPIAAVRTEGLAMSKPRLPQNGGRGRKGNPESVGRMPYEPLRNPGGLSAGHPGTVVHSLLIVPTITPMHTTPVSVRARLRHQPDAQSWQQFVAIYHPWLRDWLGAHSLQTADVEDVVQEVLAVLVKEIDHFEHNGRRGAS